MNIIGCIPRLFKKHGGWILTALGAAGFVGTTLLVADEAPKAKEALAAAKEEKNEELTFGEKFDISAPIFLPAALLGTTTLGCMIGAQIFNVKQQALLVAAYGALAQEFHQYRLAIKQEHGEEADQRALEISQAKLVNLREELNKIKKEHGPFYYTYASLPGVIFESTPAYMTNVFLHWDRNFMLCGENSLKELYEFTGLHASLWNEDDAEENGWEVYENEVTWGSCIGGFFLDKVGEKHGIPVYLIDFTIPPYKLRLNYGATDSSVENMYSGYDPDKAKALAQAVTDNEIVKPEEKYLYIQSSF